MSGNDDLITVNSGSYWDKRFSEDWGEMDGPSQSRFFARLALHMIPAWIIREIRRERFTVVDWGCAEGDGTDVLTEAIDKSQMVGIDISNVAIETAVNRYPGISFQAADLLSGENAQKAAEFDVIFSSNTVEHFHAPFDVLESLAMRARKAVILLLPYREHTRIDEHFSTFTPGNIPCNVGQNFSLVYSKVWDCSELPDTQWRGEQILLVYADNAWISSLSLVLSDHHVEADNLHQKIEAAGVLLAEEVSRSKALQAQFSFATGQVDKLTKELRSEAVKIESLENKLAACSQDLSNKQATLDELADINSEVARLKSRNVELLQSTSWRVTAPLRFFGRAYRGRNKFLYSAAKRIYWSLPSSWRDSMQGPRHAIVRRLRSDRNENRSNGYVSTSGDMSWMEFNNTVLSNRDDYKGVFIQELVIDWNVPLYQRPQHISVAMGRLGYLVIYRTDNWAGDNVDGFREVERNVWITNRQEVDGITGALRSIYSTAYAHSLNYVKSLKENNVLVYEYIDHIDPEISGDQENINRLLALKDFAFKGGADYVVASAKQLHQEAVQALGAERVVLAQNGVDTRHYRDTVHDHAEVSEDLEEFCRNHDHIVGYFGALAPWLWYEVIAKLTDKRADIGFVFIGPDYYGGSAKLPQGENVLYLGVVDYKVLPAYAKRFDVCFIPFKPGDIAQSTSPLKLFEYFALEKPVVVTSDMRECVQYPEVFHGENVEELSAAIDEALAIKDDALFKQRMAELADENDWDKRAEAMSKCFPGFKSPDLQLSKETDQ